MTQVKSVTLLGDGTVRVTRTETPSDARQRLMDTPDKDLTKENALSFHSAIPANPEHSRRAVAYDLAIGQAKSINDEAFYSYLCRVADWRLGWGEQKNYSGFQGSSKQESTQDDPNTLPGVDTLAFYKKEAPDNKALIDAAADYRAQGKPDA